MAHKTLEGIGKNLTATDDVAYSEGMAKSLLQKNYEFKFEKIEVVSDMDEFG